MRADDEPAWSFEEFEAASASRLLLSATLLVGGDRAAGEDLLQAAFEKTYRHWDRVSHGQPEAYVRRALVNGATSRWRRLRARVPEVPLLADAGPLLADHTDRVLLRDSLLRALLSLPPKQRAVIVLRYLDDLPDAAVAQALGCSESSVRSQASRGLARLRENEHLHTERGQGTPDVISNEPSDPPPLTALPVDTPLPRPVRRRLRPTSGGPSTSAAAAQARAQAADARPRTAQPRGETPL